MNISPRKSGGRQRGGGARGKEISESAHHLSASYHHLEWCCPPSSTAGGRGGWEKGVRLGVAANPSLSVLCRPRSSVPSTWCIVQRSRALNYGAVFSLFSKFNLIVLKWRAALCNAQFDSPLFVSVIHAELLCVCACVRVCAPQT